MAVYIASIEQEARVRQIERLMSDESGATAIEYGLIAALVAIAIIGSMKSLGTSLDNTWGKVSSNLAG